MKISELSKNIRLINKEETDTKITYFVESKLKELECPCCHTKSSSVHSLTPRICQDLPEKGKTVYISITNNRMMKCKNPNCEVKRFKEQYDFLKDNEKLTIRLRQHILDVAYTMSNLKTVASLKAEGIQIEKTAISVMMIKDRKNKN